MQFQMSWPAIPMEIFLLINSVAASPPHLIRDLDVFEMPQVRGLGVAHHHQISKRNESTTLGTASLATSFSNDVLFSFALDGGISIPGNPNLTATCLSCFTTGTASLLSTGFTQDEALLADIPAATVELIKDPLGFIKEALAVQFEIDLQGLSGHFEVDVQFAAAGTFSVPLLPPIQPLGAMLGGNEIGFIFSIDLVFSVTGAIDATGGFDIAWPNTTSIIIDPLKGDILSLDVSGIQVSPLPFQFHTGSACVQVALRFGLKAGLGISLLSTGANIEAGVFVDAPAYQACAKFNSTAPCNLGLTQRLFGDAGAFADIAVKIDFVNFQQGPNVVTTFFSADLPSTCLASSTTLAIASTTSNASVTSAPAYNNVTTTVKHTTATTKTVATSLPANATVCSIVGCESNLLWCPTSLQTTITITKPAATTTAAVSHVTITSAVTITAFSSPIASTIQATIENATVSSTIVRTSGGNFAQESKNATIINTAKMISIGTTASSSSIAVAGVIVSVGGYGAASTSGASNGSSNSTAVQVTNAGSLSRLTSSGSAWCAMVFAFLGLLMLL
ncbi:hypothetical protein BDZ45DRAFT_742022 [Acephala macrosclerotiorum]|nr:hypothetical protein BDZ45DRAFT_742022 [Acephala macrosclerotiorum]